VSRLWASRVHYEKREVTQHLAWWCRAALVREGGTCHLTKRKRKKESDPMLKWSINFSGIYVNLSNFSFCCQYVRSWVFAVYYPVKCRCQTCVFLWPGWPSRLQHHGLCTSVWPRRCVWATEWQVMHGCVRCQFGTRQWYAGDKAPNAVYPRKVYSHQQRKKYQRKVGSLQGMIWYNIQYFCTHNSNDWGS